jgi:hypothetical protein
MADENKMAADGDTNTVTRVTKTTTTTTRVAPPAPETSADGPSASMASKTVSLLAAYEAWVGSHSGLARNVETTLYVAPQLVPVRALVENDAFSTAMLEVHFNTCMYCEWRESRSA